MDVKLGCMGRKYGVGNIIVKILKVIILVLYLD